MAASALRRRAVTLLCVAVTLAAVLARAATTTLTSNTVMTGETFNGATLAFDTTSAGGDAMTVQLISSQVSGSGLTLDGGASKGSTRLIVSMASTTVTESTIVFSGTMPANSQIRAVSTTASLTSSQSLFSFVGLLLNNNASIIIEDTAATWPSGANTGSVVAFSTGSTAIGISTTSALFVLNATATNGASVLSINTNSDFKVSSNSVLAVDYCRCTTCSVALVDIETPLTVDGSSVFRVTNGTVTGGSARLLISAGSTTVSDGSLYLISNSVVTNAGDLFNYVTDTGAPYDFTVTSSSTATFLNLQAVATGVPASSPVPSSIGSGATGSGATVIGGGCVIGGSSLTSVDDYARVGLDVTKVVGSNGASNGVCANAQCLPRNTVAGGAAPSSGNCACTCSSGSYLNPTCTSVSDPTLTYNGAQVCTVPECATCDRAYPDRCVQCNPGYTLNANYACTVTTTTTTTTTTTRTPTCNVPYCNRCLASDPSRCSVCHDAYYVSDGLCIANNNAAAAAHSAVLAAAVCVAAAVYAL